MTIVESGDPNQDDTEEAEDAVATAQTGALSPQHTVSSSAGITGL